MKAKIVLVFLFIGIACYTQAQKLSTIESWMVNNTSIDQIKEELPSDYQSVEQWDETLSVEYHFERIFREKVYQLIIMYDKDEKVIKAIHFEEPYDKVWSRFDDIRSLGYKRTNSVVRGHMEVNTYENAGKMLMIGMILNEDKKMEVLNFKRL